MRVYGIPSFPTLLFAMLVMPLSGTAQFSSIKVVNAATGKVLDGTQPTESGEEPAIRLTKWDNQPGQRWKMTPAPGTGGRFFLLINESTGLALTASCGASFRSCQVLERPRDNTAPQQWEMVGEPSHGSKLFLNPSTRFFLGGMKGSVNGNSSRLGPWDGLYGQNWIVEPVRSDMLGEVGYDPDEEGVVLSIPPPTCTFAAGDWADPSQPYIRWHLEQKDADIKGMASFSRSASCGAVVWRVSGMMHDEGKVELKMDAVSGLQDRCGNVAPPFEYISLDLQLPTCGEAQVTIRDAGMTGTTWRRIGESWFK